MREIFGRSKEKLPGIRMQWSRDSVHLKNRKEVTLNMFETDESYLLREVGENFVLNWPKPLKNS